MTIGDMQFEVVKKVDTKKLQVFRFTYILIFINI